MSNLTYLRIALFVFGIVTCILILFAFVKEDNTYYSFHLKSNTQSSSSSVVKIVHQTWKTSTLPPRFQLWAGSWKSCFPDWEYKLWTDEDNEQFIKLHYPWFHQRYISFPRNIHRVDIIRYFYLFHYGGIYADLDAECLRPFSHLLEPHSVVFGAMKGQYHNAYIKEGYTQNSFMYSKPRHTMWLDLIHDIMSSNNTWSAEALTGPLKLIHLIKRFRSRFPNEVKIYPPEYFNPFSWLHKPPNSPCKTRNNMTPEEVVKCRQAFNNSFVLQYHSQTWGMGKIL